MREREREREFATLPSLGNSGQCGPVRPEQGAECWPGEAPPHPDLHELQDTFIIEHARRCESWRGAS